MWSTLKVLKDLLSILEGIREQKARCVRAQRQAQLSHGSCHRHLRLGSSVDGR